MSASIEPFVPITSAHASELHKLLTGLYVQREEALWHFQWGRPVFIRCDLLGCRMSNEEELDAVITWLEDELARVNGLPPRRERSRGAYR